MCSLDRRTLGQFLPNPESVRAFERMFKAVEDTLPATIEEANALAGNAAAVAAQALAMLADLAGMLEQVAMEPASLPQIDADDTAPRVHLGTMSSQDNDSVDITGGKVGVDAGAVDAPTLYFGQDPQTGLYRSDASRIAISIALVKLVEFSAQLIDITGALKVSKQITSTLPDGTAPLVVASKTRVDNLNADLLDGKDWAAPAAIGGTTPAAAVFTDLSATGNFGCNGKPSQDSYALGPAASDLASAITLVNNIRLALIANGIGS